MINFIKDTIKVILYLFALYYCLLLFIAVSTATQTFFNSIIEFFKSVGGALYV
jgi:hypothetical protein